MKLIFSMSKFSGKLKEQRYWAKLRSWFAKGWHAGVAGRASTICVTSAFTRLARYHWVRRSAAFPIRQNW